MRLDMFLKISRLVKRRSVAKEFCGSGRILVGAAPAKPGREVKGGDIITLDLARRKTVVEVLEIPKGNVSKDMAAGLYRVIEDTVKGENLL